MFKNNTTGERKQLFKSRGTRTPRTSLLYHQPLGPLITNPIHKTGIKSLFLTFLYFPSQYPLSSPFPIFPPAVEKSDFRINVFGSSFLAELKMTTHKLSFLLMLLFSPFSYISKLLHS